METKKIKTEADLKAAALEFYKYVKQAAEEKPDGIFYRQLERTIHHAGLILHSVGIDPKTI